jgi:septal ring factor EnvC (AmiA/AmiB activator)
MSDEMSTGEVGDVQEAYGFDRLERAVAALVEQHERMQKENGELRRDLAEKTDRLRALEEQLLEANQRRKDVAKRVDDLIAQLDQLDAQLGSVEAAS